MVGKQVKITNGVFKGRSGETISEAEMGNAYEDVFKFQYPEPHLVVRVALNGSMIDPYISVKDLEVVNGSQ